MNWHVFEYAGPTALAWTALMVSFVRVARNEVNDIDKLKSGEGPNEEPDKKPNVESSGELTEALSEQTP